MEGTIFVARYPDDKILSMPNVTMGFISGSSNF